MKEQSFCSCYLCKREDSLCLLSFSLSSIQSIYLCRDCLNRVLALIESERDNPTQRAITRCFLCDKIIIKQSDLVEHVVADGIESVDLCKCCFQTASERDREIVVKLFEEWKRRERICRIKE